MKQNLMILIICCLLSIKKGLGMVTFSNPPSGSVVSGFKGTINATTLTCNVSNGSTGYQIASRWTVKDFRNVSGYEVVTQVASDLFHVDDDPDISTDNPGAKFNNRLTILDFTSELDGEILYCGTKANPEEANFTLRLYSPPGEPHAVTTKVVGATWIFLTWEAPDMTEYPTTSYEIRRNDSQIESSPLLLTTGNNDTFFNVTGLLPGTTYELTVVAVSRVGDVIAKSEVDDNFVVQRTEVTVPSLTCNATAMSVNGSITVTWSYIHTGGLPLTNISVSYSFTKTLKTFIKPVTLKSIDTTSVTVLGIEVGFQYIFNVTAENRNGSSSALCKVSVDEINNGSNSRHSASTVVAIIFGVLGGILILGFLLTLLGFLIKKAQRRKGGAERNYEPHLQQYYSDHLLKPFTTNRQPKKNVFTDVHNYPSLIESGNRNTSTEYPVYDM